MAGRWERKEKKRPRVVKSQWSILDIADIVLVSPRPASENNQFLVQIFNHIASHLSFNPQHTHGGLGAPQNRSKFKMISKCLAANLIHINRLNSVKNTNFRLDKKNFFLMQWKIIFWVTDHFSVKWSFWKNAFFCLKNSFFWGKMQFNPLARAS